MARTAISVGAMKPAKPAEMMMPAAVMEPEVSAMMPAASGCFGRDEHCRAKHGGGAKDHEFMHWTLPSRALWPPGANSFNAFKAHSLGRCNCADD
jgi:hypothetical protein